MPHNSSQRISNLPVAVGVSHAYVTMPTAGILSRLSPWLKFPIPRCRVAELAPALAGGGPAFPAERIFRELLNDRHETALALLDAARARDPRFDIHSHLSEIDYRDCLFLLAEAREKQGELRTALELYEAAAALERGEALRYFLDVAEKRADKIRRRLNHSP